MPKTLLKNLSENPKTNGLTTMTSADENIEMIGLMLEMKKHLNQARTELLQPRPEAIQQLLKKALR
jgi:hypothetical protein